MSQRLLNPRFLFGFFYKEIRAIAIFSFVANMLMLVPTLYMMQVTDRVFYSRSDITLLTLSVIMVFLYLILGFSEWMRTRVLVSTSVKIDQLLGLKILRAAVYKRLAGINVNSDQIFSDMTQLRQFLTGVAVFALFDLPWMPIYVIVSYFLHPWLGIFALISTLFLIGVAIHAHHTSARTNLDAIEVMTDESRTLNYRLRHIDVLESMGMYLNVKNSWLAKHTTSLNIYAKQQHATHVNLGLSKFFRYVFQSLSLALGAWLVIQDELRPGAMIAANFLVARATQPVDMIVSSWNQFYMAGVIFKRLKNLIADVPDDISEVNQYQDNQSIQVKELSAFNHDGTHRILEKITVQIDPGSFWAVLGPSGAGKTTFVRSLIGVWPYFSGEILYGQNNVKSIDRNSYGSRVGYLPQDVELFDGTIAENISRFGELNSDEVIKAASLVGIHQTILAMSDGYDTMVGEMGANLSGGQRQRVGLARALYGDPDLIILDEPNSSLDDAGQRALFEVLNHLKQQGKKIILVAHYGDLINLATHHMVLDKGKLLSAARVV